MMSRSHVARLFLASFGTAFALRAQAQAVAERSWPQQFTLERGDRVSYGFVVGIPGAIVVNVTAAGQVAVAVYKPNGSLAKNALGAGAVRIEYAATKEDIAAGEAWRVTLAEPSGGRGRGVLSATPAPPAASGSITITHPPGDVRKVRLTTVRQPAAAAVASADPDPSLQAYRAAREAAQTTARAQRARLLQAKVTATAAVAQAGSLPPAPRGTTSRGAAAVAAQAGAATSTSKSADIGTGSTGGGAAPVGSNQPATVASVPVITSLDTAGGRPGDQVLVTGSGFSPATGLEAHFIIGPQKDFPATITYYNDGQIIVQVPDKEGLPSYAGRFYLSRGTNNGRLIPFRFDPKMDYATLPVSNDRQLSGANEFVVNQYVGHWPEFFTCKDNDEFFLHTTLANGWVVDSAYVRQQNHGGLGPALLGDPGVKGDAYVSEVALGSSSPRIKVHWWCEELFFERLSPQVRYWPVVVIRGPKGLPWQ